MEIYISIMAGFVLGFFLLVGEFAALRKQIPMIQAHFRLMSQSGKRLRLLVAICGIVAFLLITPILVAVLVVLVLNNFSSNFTANLLRG